MVLQLVKTLKKTKKNSGISQIFIKNIKNTNEKTPPTFIIITLSTMSFCQKDLSLTIGANRSNVIWTNLEEIGWKHKMGYFIGLRNSYLKTKKIELSSELQFSNKGWENTNNKQNYKYLDVLHSVTYKPIKLAGIFVGFNTAYLISNKNKQMIDTNFDFGVLGGVTFGGPKMKIFGLYNLGLINTELDTPGLEELNIKVINRNLQIGVRYTFYDLNK